MPARGWWDSATGRARPFGSEWAWEDPPVAPELMASMAKKIVAHASKHDYGMTLSPSRVTVPTRSVLIQKFVDYYVDPESEGGQHIGTLTHLGLEGELRDVGYDTETRLSGTLTFGHSEKFKLVGIPDAHWPLDRQPNIPDNMDHIVELKTTSSGSMRFLLEDGTPKEDHRAQVSIYAHLYSQKYGIPFEEVRVSIHYFCIPQKERLMGAFTRMPPSKVYPVPVLMSDVEIGAVIPGYSPPKKASDYQGPPPERVMTNAILTTRAFGAIESGKPPEEVIEQFDCQCERRFNGSGRDYCSVMRNCAMLDHGTPMW